MVVAPRSLDVRAALPQVTAKLSLFMADLDATLAHPIVAILE
jgi:hypothetical protein